MGWGGAGRNSVPQISPVLGTLAKVLTIPTLNPQPQAPAPGQTALSSCLLHLAGGEKAAFSRFILKDASKSKQSRCLIEKINYGKMWHLATMPLSQLCFPPPPC